MEVAAQRLKLTSEPMVLNHVMLDMSRSCHSVQIRLYGHLLCAYRMQVTMEIHTER